MSQSDELIETGRRILALRLSLSPDSHACLAHQTRRNKYDGENIAVARSLEEVAVRDLNAASEMRIAILILCGFLLVGCSHVTGSSPIPVNL